MSVNRRQLISIVFSFKNEEEVLVELLKRLHAVFDGLDVDCEFIFVNDDSTDRSLEILMEQSVNDPCIRIVNMSSTFGVNPCFIAGMRYSKGDAVVTMDTDLQDPPEVIPQLIEKWREGADVVHTTRESREGESAIKMYITHTAYRILNRLSEIDLPIDTGMFKLISRRVVDTIMGIDETDPFLRGLLAWVGFKQAFVMYKREERFAGFGHFSILTIEPWLVFVRGLLSFSRVPIGLLLLLGTALSGCGLIGLISLAVFSADVLGDKGYWGLLLCVVVFLGGLQIVTTSIIGLYLTRVYNQVKPRPEYIVESTHGFPDEDE